MARSGAAGYVVCLQVCGVILWRFLAAFRRGMACASVPWQAATAACESTEKEKRRGVCPVPFPLRGLCAVRLSAFHQIR